MAFIQAIPVSSSRSHASVPAATRPTRRGRSSGGLVAVANKPEPPATFSKPEPRRFYVRPDKVGEMASLSVGSALRFGNGALVEGYRVRRGKDTTSQRLEEYSATLPQSRPIQPLHLFEFEACPFCRRVREAVTMLDIDVVVFPCPRGSAVYREYVSSKGGKTQFPYLEDPNSGFAGYESSDIIRYLYETYGPSSVRVPVTLSSVATMSAGLAAALRSGKGRKRPNATVPAKEPIEFWGYEPSPFCKLVREALNDLELAHIWHTTARGSDTRRQLKEKTGRFQVPYIIDHNTGVDMFESAEIVEYLYATYGPSAPGAVESPDSSALYMPGDPLPTADDAASATVDVPPQQDPPSLDPQPPKDESLERYCEDNPEADECRVYED